MFTARLMRGMPTTSKVFSQLKATTPLTLRCRTFTSQPQPPPPHNKHKNVQEEIRKLKEKAKAQGTTAKPASASSPPPATHHHHHHHQQMQQEEDPDSPKAKFPPWMRHVGTLVAFAAVSFGLAVYSIEHDDPFYYLMKFTERMQPLQSNDPEKIKATLDKLALYTQTNDLMKRKVVETGHFQLLLNLVVNGSTVEIKNLAARTIDNVCLDDKNKEDLLASGHIKEIVSILKDETQLEMPLYTRKALGTAISHLAIIPHLRIQLAEMGVPSALTDLQADDRLKRQAFSRAITYIATTSSISTQDTEILRKSYSIEERKGTLGKIQNTLVDNGLTMYLHTSAGGAVWGACEALRRKENLRGILRSAARTAFITGLIPIYFVGLGVSMYNSLHKQVASPENRFYLTFVTCMSLYPWVYLLPIVERISPYWVGGHVVGFTSFFTWLLISGNDLLKSDTLLATQDQIAATRAKKNKESIA